MTTDRLPCFKAYDVRGRVPDELDADLARRIGRAYAAEVSPAGPVAVGRDVRLTSPALARALIAGLNDAGVDTLDLGLCGTEQVYFTAARPGTGGGIMVTASHNPAAYNGMKFVRGGAVPIGGDTGLDAIEERVRHGRLGAAAGRPGRNAESPAVDAYVRTVLACAGGEHLRPLVVVANAGNGCAGPVVDALAPHLPFGIVRVHHEPDGRFPHGVPNPMLPEMRAATSAAVRDHRADLGVAWDGDFDRCFLFDETGAFVDGYYVVGLLAARQLAAHPGARVVHDSRLTWNTVEVVRAAGGVPVACRTGHVFMKERMRAEDALYGGEISAHHYFRSFAYCDSGMVPWLLVAALLSETGRPLSAIVAERRCRYPASGEINSTVADAAEVVRRVRERYAPQATREERIDGLSLEFGSRWRFNLRSSQTEPILRLNVEARDDAGLVREKTDELVRLIRGPGAAPDPRPATDASASGQPRTTADRRPAAGGREPGG